MISTPMVTLPRCLILSSVASAWAVPASSARAAATPVNGRAKEQKEAWRWRMAGKRKWQMGSDLLAARPMRQQSLSMNDMRAMR
ncbi:hypothetical protein [Comamonas endophytica]|uniref:hypothetical protein n=1 Tax=Comamonas endophytica TaxID=2949090 RepID=UPI00366BA48F